MSVNLLSAPDWVLRLTISSPPKDVSDFVDSLGPLDLRTAPGVSEGSRNNTLCKLMGAHLGRGEDPELVLLLGYEFGDRCVPPVERKEVHSIWNSLEKKEAAKIEGVPIPEQVQWPVLDEAAYHGLSGEFVGAIEPSTEADRVAILVNTLAYFGNVIGRSAHFKVEATPHYTNLFVVDVGETSRGRKGTGHGRVRALFEPIDPKWVRDCTKGGVVSGEGIIYHVRDPLERTEPVKVKGTREATEAESAASGVRDKRLLIREGEFASLLQIIRREGNTASAILRDAWDTGDLRTLSKNSPLKATGAHISISGDITLEELRNKLPSVEGFSGFANRFLWICVRRSKKLPEGGKPLGLSPLIKRLEEAVVFASLTGEMVRDEAAKALWAEIYNGMKDHRGLLGAVTSRAEAQILRLSMCYALLDRSEVIRVEHLRAAHALWRYAEDSARYIFGDSTGDALADKILDVIKKNDTVPRRELHRALSNHCNASELTRALGRLRDAGLVVCEMDRSTRGRPAERWRLA